MFDKSTWRLPDENLLFIGIFGFCPLLLKCATLLSGLVMGAAALFVLVSATMTLSIFRCFVPYSARLVFILIINASWVTVLDLLLQAYVYEARLHFGIYIPLLAVNAVLLVQEQEALKQTAAVTLKRIILTGLMISASLIILGSARELLASGALLTDTHLFPANFLPEFFTPIHFADSAALLFNKTAGAFICLGLFIASVNYVREMHSKKID